MVKHVCAFLIVAAAFVSGLACNEGGRLTAGQAHELIRINQSNKSFVVIDCRPYADFIKGHLEKAIHIDICNEIFLNKYDELNRESTYLIYCKSGLKSSIVYNYLKEKKFHKLYDMKGGIKHWIREGYPVVK
jgi:rhodanese-related sulfurtransferase